MLRPRHSAQLLDAGMRIAISIGMSSEHLTVDPTNETLGWRRTVDLLVLDQVRIEAWDRILFVECGDGWIVEEAWRRMGKGSVCGLSTSQRLVDLAVRLRGVPGRVEFKTWGGERFPLPDRSFDRVISCVPWHGYLEPVAVLREMARVLRPDGDAYLLEFDRSTPPIPEAVQPAHLGQLLANTGLGEVRWDHGETAPRGEGDRATPVVGHARPRPAGT